MFFKEKPEELNPNEVELTNLLHLKEIKDEERRMEEETKMFAREKKLQHQRDAKRSQAEKNEESKKKM